MASLPFWRTILRILLVGAVLALLPALAHAEGTRRAGIVRLTTATGHTGPLHLRPDATGFTGELIIVNDGKEPLVVSRIAVRGDAADPRVPPKLSARLSEGSLPITLPPGGTRTATVSWTPELPLRQRQLFGHVLVTTSDEKSGDVAMGVRAQRRGLFGPLEGHVLSLLVGLPLLGAICIFLARAFGRRDGETSSRFTIAVLGSQLVVALYMYANFVPDVSRLDGNDGLQFIEHIVWSRRLAAELYFGADALAVTSIVVTSLVAFVAALLDRASLPHAQGYHAALLLLEASTLGALVSMDGLVFVVFAATVVSSAALLLLSTRDSDPRRAARRLGFVGGVAVGLVAVALFLVSRHAEPTLLVDGTAVPRTLSLPELSRMALGAKVALLFGASVSKVAFALTVIAALTLLAAFPMHRWLGEVLVVAPRTTGILIVVALPLLGLAVLLRIGCAVLPEGMRWASGLVVALGAVTAAYGAFSALGEIDLRRMCACATTTHAGFFLLGTGSLTREGLAGVIVLAATRTIACSAFLLLVASIAERAHTTDVRRLRGVASVLPGWGSALALAAFAQAAVLGTGGAWGPVLALLGVFAGYAPLAIVGALALIVLSAAPIIALSPVAFAPIDPAWKGGFLGLRKREWVSVAPLLLLLAVLGVWPAPLASLTTGTVHDLVSVVSPRVPSEVIP